MNDHTEHAVWCDWHGGPCQTGVLIEIIERMTAASVCRYACRSCRDNYALKPYADPPASRV